MRPRYTQRGQSALETAAVMGALMAMVVGTAKIWTWFDTMMVKRQESYQSDRVIAGKFGVLGVDANGEPDKFSFGEPLKYKPDRLVIFTPGSAPVGTDCVANPENCLAPPDCPAGQPFADQAEQVEKAAEEKTQQSEAKRKQGNDLYGEQLQVTGGAYQYHCQDQNEQDKLACDMEFTVDNGTGPITKKVFDQNNEFDCNNMFMVPVPVAVCSKLEDYSQYLNDKLQPYTNQADQLNDQAAVLYQQAQDLYNQALQICENGSL